MHPLGFTKLAPVLCEPDLDPPKSDDQDFRDVFDSGLNLGKLCEGGVDTEAVRNVEMLSWSAAPRVGLVEIRSWYWKYMMRLQVTIHVLVLLRSARVIVSTVELL